MKAVPWGSNWTLVQLDYFLLDTEPELSAFVTFRITRALFFFRLLASAPC